MATDPEGHLSQLTTLWSVVRQAHQGGDGDRTEAQKQLLDRYGGAVYRYLLGAVRDQQAADDVYQEFALRFVRGDFHRADPEHGRFRDYLKTSLFHLVGHYRKQQRHQPVPLPDEVAGPEAEAGMEADREFIHSWRSELLARAWQALAVVEGESGQPFYTVLRYRLDHPDLPSHEMAAELSARLGKPLTAAGVRQTLHRARERFAALLLDDVAQSLTDPSPERLAEELTVLNLLNYCRPALQRYGAHP